MLLPGQFLIGEVLDGIIVTKPLYHPANHVEIGRYNALFHIVTQHVAQRTPVVFVSGKRQETTGVGHHADEPVQQTHV